ncbi:hypothetical protein QAD02_022472 [Eretmocerus hayati]|uniref:Uncharacterized protein n=1 Tax=Eretmocerus hayati TaxID=131215 RepID=A0ACC2PT64_9HYME|nr:hypothetical protein QAD02_022472 [Eretmocerus hayati]
MSFTNFVVTRSLFTSCSRYGKRNFRKFDLKNKRGSRIFKKMQSENPDPDYPIDKRGVRDVGYTQNGKFIKVPEMIPELVVPNLQGFTLKPYVSYRSLDVFQDPFTAQDLFNAVYASKIKEDFEKGQLDSLGEPLNPSPEEKLTPKEARALASKTGCDMFTAPPDPLGTLYPSDPK